MTETLPVIEETTQSHFKSRMFVRALLAFFLLGIFVLYGTFFTVKTNQVAIVTRLGNPVRILNEPGPYFKWPTPIEKLDWIDTRSQLLHTPGATSFTRDKKSVVISTYVVWRITDPLLFLQSTRTIETAESHLVSLVRAAKNTELGQHDLAALVTINAELSSAAEIEAAVQRSVNEAALAKLGVTVEEVGIERIGFPNENMPAVLDRMRAEREAEANRLRSEGAKLARKVRDEAHVESQKILRKGKEEASRIASDAERQAGQILAAAYERDPEFYRFWLSLQSSRKLLDGNARLILRSDQPPFDVLTQDPEESASDSAEEPVPPYLLSSEGEDGGK